MVRIEVRRRGMLRSDSGITTIQVLIMFPIMMIIVGMAMQVALNYYAKQVALAAAQEGVNTVRLTGNQLQSPADISRAQNDANTSIAQYLAKHGGKLITVTSVVASRSRFSITDLVQVRVQGSAISLVPFLPIIVDQRAIGAIEEFTSGTDE